VWHYACRYGGRSLFVNVAPKMNYWTEAIVALCIFIILIIWCGGVIFMFWG
jgi:hypothetical protein